jgi:hypothetical protein
MQTGVLQWEVLEAMGWTEKELPRRAKDDKGKVRLARQLRAETTVTLGWIARQLQTGTGGYENHLYINVGRRINASQDNIKNRPL